MTKEQAKEKIQKLIEGYQQLSPQEIKAVNEVYQLCIKYDKLKLEAK